MPYYDLVWYCNAGDQATTGYYAVPKRPQNTAVVAGQLCRQFTAPPVGSERVFICIVAGSTANVTDATWVLTRGAKTVDGTATWMECTGMAAVNGDKTNTVNWTAAKAIGTPTLGTIIKRANAASYWICSTAGTLGVSEPAWPNDTAGTTQADGTVTWTCLGVVGDFTGGQAPFARIVAACAGNWFAAGNTVYVGDNHAETQAALINFAPAGSNTTIGRFLCHNHSGSYPPASTDLTTGATITTTGSQNMQFSPTAGFYYFSGLSFISSGALTMATAASFAYFDRCLFSSTGGGNISLGPTGGGISVLTLNNSTVKFAAATPSVVLNGSGTFLWQNTGTVLAPGSSVPNTFVTNGGGQNATLEALDLSQLTGTLVSGSGSTVGTVTIKDCKLNASATVLGASPLPGTIVQLVRCDSGATAYKSARYTVEGTETTETSITRVGGAADPTAQAQSRKIITTASSQWLRPFKAEPFAIWNPTTAANVTVTVCGTINAGALPNNDDIWLEIEYLGSSATPLGTIVATTKSNVLAAGSAVASDGSTWNVPAFTAWNPADLIAMTLSNNNLTATATAGSGVRTKDGLASGKYYWEITVSTWAQIATSVGFQLGTTSLSNLTNVSMGRLGSIVVNNVNSGSSLGARSAGDTIGIALDVGNNLCWFRVTPSGNWNGSGTANPATGVGGVNISTLVGTQFPTFMGNGSGEVATANFGGSAFSGTVPSGFNAGVPSGWSPFKLTATLSSPQPGMAGYLHARVRAAKPSATFYIDPQITLS